MIAELSEDVAAFAGGGRQISVSPGDSWLVFQVAINKADIRLVENFR